MLMDDDVLLAQASVGVMSVFLAKLTPGRSASAMIVSIYLHFIVFYFLVF
jgi:hypothetical protein